MTVLPGGSTSPSVVVAGDESNGKTVYVQVGARVELILSSSYWTVHDSSMPAVLRQNGATTQLPKPASCPDIPGLGCNPLRTDFIALAPGTALLTASRTSYGEAMACAPSRQHFTLTVTVRK